MTDDTIHDSIIAMINGALEASDNHHKMKYYANAQRIKQIEDLLDALTNAKTEPALRPEPADTVTSDATTSAPILNDAASLIEESRRSVFTAKGLALTAPEVQTERVDLPASTERALDRIGDLVEKAIRQCARPDAFYYSPSSSFINDSGSESTVDVALMIQPYSTTCYEVDRRPTDLTLVVSRFKGTVIERETVVIPATAREVDDIDAAANEAWWKIRRRIEASIATTRVIDQLAHTLET